MGDFCIGFCKEVFVVPDSLFDVRHICLEEAKKRDGAANEDAFCLVNLDEIIRRVELWQSEFPNVKPFFAMKSNPDPFLFEILSLFGCGIDCASSSEIDFALAHGATPNNILNSHPCNSEKSIKHTAAKEVKLIVFDCKEELKAIANLHPGAKPILRVSLCSNDKFGAIDSDSLIEYSKELNIQIAGVSFYVGPARKGVDDFTRALDIALSVLKKLDSSAGRLILNIGGSFPGFSTENSEFVEIAQALQDRLSSLADVDIIAEPGKFFSASPFTLCTRIMLAKEVSADPPKMMYYLNQGIYTSFMGAAITNKILPLRGEPLQETPGPEISAVIWGPTCDGADCIEQSASLPRLHSGDWMMFPERGAYSFSMASNFNGFKPPDFCYVSSESAWNKLMEHKTNIAD